MKDGFEGAVRGGGREPDQEAELANQGTGILQPREGWGQERGGIIVKSGDCGMEIGTGTQKETSISLDNQVALG